MYKLTMEDKEIILKGKGQRIGLAILIGIAVVIFVLAFLDARQTRDIKTNFERTLGTLTTYEDILSVENSGTYIEYSFNVKSKLYSRKVNTNVKFKKCQDSPMNCVGSKYWVIYEKGHPENSLIDLEFELKGDTTLFPPSLDSFF